jgi:hypothetical protein
MRILAIVALATTVCLGSAAESWTKSAAPANAFLDWTVSPGIFAEGGPDPDIWTIPGTTTLTASVTDDFGAPITQGELVWEICSANERGFLVGRPASDCEQRGHAVRWNDAVILDPANPTDVHPHYCIGQQVGWRLAYHGRGGFRSTTGEPFDLFAEISDPSLNCP